MSWSEAWGLTVLWHRLSRHAVQGSLSGGPGIVPVHAPVQPAWSTVGTVMSWSEAWGFLVPLHDCVVTLCRARRKVAQAESLFMPLYSQHGQL